MRDREVIRAARNAQAAVEAAEVAVRGGASVSEAQRPAVAAGYLEVRLALAAGWASLAMAAEARASAQRLLGLDPSRAAGAAALWRDYCVRDLGEGEGLSSEDLLALTLEIAADASEPGRSGSARV